MDLGGPIPVSRVQFGSSLSQTLLLRPGLLERRGGLAEFSRDDLTRVLREEGVEFSRLR